MWRGKSFENMEEAASRALQRPPSWQAIWLCLAALVVGFFLGRFSQNPAEPESGHPYEYRPGPGGTLWRIDKRSGKTWFSGTSGRGSPLWEEVPEEDRPR